MAGDEAKEAFLVLDGPLGANRLNAEFSVCDNKTPPPTRNLSTDAATRSRVTAAPEAGQEENGVSGGRSATLLHRIVSPIVR